MQETHTHYHYVEYSQYPICTGTTTFQIHFKRPMHICSLPSEFTEPFDQAFRSNLGSESSYETSPLFGQTC